MTPLEITLFAASVIVGALNVAIYYFNDQIARKFIEIADTNRRISESNRELSKQNAEIYALIKQIQERP